ncbi:MAG: 4'-phosphopantetheinyl transferase superfamily protein [Gammaproteobacteria bacterium]|nr:4'-phosphopantetheinyl transferase superfamily protein [Gammaproteobacteria bacterium]MBT8444781.1 4'-phosphopantetheinyl transferase superfamily protein [Gammaproteobacteria bacterium]NND35641.1 4'-phosphopantetheinyl transferase superfamily protein [Gammaproteobacteria bacterium]
MTVLEGLFPEQVRCVLSTDFPAEFVLLGAERDQLVAMATGRRREFIHGRSCARLALAGLGHADCPVPSGPQRAPVWPDGVVGSISHCGDAAAAAVAHRNGIGGIGLDLEAREELDRNLLPMICRPRELATIETSDIGLLLAKLIFSAKESVFKCIWPQVRHFVDFLDVEIEIDLDASRFAARPHAADLPEALFGRLRGRVGQAEELFVTAAYLE